MKILQGGRRVRKGGGIYLFIYFIFFSNLDLYIVCSLLRFIIKTNKQKNRFIIEIGDVARKVVGFKPLNSINIDTFAITLAIPNSTYIVIIVIYIHYIH